MVVMYFAARMQSNKTALSRNTGFWRQTAVKLRIYLLLLTIN